MSAILKFDFQKRKQLRFSEVNYLNYTKRPNFACDYSFSKTKGNKNKQWTHSTPVNSSNKSFIHSLTQRNVFLAQTCVFFYGTQHMIDQEDDYLKQRADLQHVLKHVPLSLHLTETIAK